MNVVLFSNVCFRFVVFKLGSLKENTFGFNPRICNYTHENTVKTGVLIEDSYMDFQFATFWKQGRGESTRQFRLWVGDVIVGINGNDIEEVVGEDLKGFEGFFKR